MNLTPREILCRLGAGESIASICETAGISRDEFNTWWTEETSRRVSPSNGTKSAPLMAAVQIDRDSFGIPHISAENDADLFFGFGYAMAGDRLFQMDFLRRKGSGRLAEILGPPGLELDFVARTVGLRHIAEAEWEELPQESRTLLTSFTSGVNAHINTLGDSPPIEFDLLGYRPEPWTEIDCLVIEVEFRWYLTGRFPVIAIPELVKRALGDGPLFHEFLLGEADDESIMPRNSYSVFASGNESVGSAIGSPFDAHGSNNWVLAGKKTETGHPFVASDPHIAFEAVSCWYEAHLCGGSFNTTGMAYVGMPAIMFGRNERVAWGCTNNICSQRDLYQEKTAAEHPGAFLFDGNWEPARELEETILVKGASPITKTIRFSRNGPIVDEILPEAARETGPVSLRWLGRHGGGWLTALLGMNRANSVGECIAATQPWQVPTFSVVLADNAGQIGFKATGRIPLRKHAERGYRSGWDPDHQWQGILPFEQMPQLIDPERGWICTANNRLADDDFPYPLSGTWSSGYRARRVRQMLCRKEKLNYEDMVQMHLDSLSLRAVECIPELVTMLQSSDDPGCRQAVEILRDWNCRCDPELVGPTLFNAFFVNWSNAVVAERFDTNIEFLAGSAGGIASRLLEGDPHEWFHRRSREQVLTEVMSLTLNQLAERFGPEMETWTWDRMHTLPLEHVLGSIGDLGELLNHGGTPVQGDMTTVSNTGYGPDGGAVTGGGYRLIADMSQSPPTLSAQDAQGQSGEPGSPHYDNQLEDWLNGRYHELPLDRAAVAENSRATLTLLPGE